MKILSQVESRENSYWKSKVPELFGQASEDKLIIHDASKQRDLGFGGCLYQSTWLGCFIQNQRRRQGKFYEV